MKNGLSFGYSTATEISHSENNWKEKVPRIALLLLLAALLALFFGYLTHSVDHKISPSSSTEAVATR
ncbi:MAG TPA: hypothetical protein VMF66_07275 [Candidatus Acidoferrum sp.]|nr:hypothetical protein [Candidatus Acidoferrum sp.]